jgi:hypothetical protein
VYCAVGLPSAYRETLEEGIWLSVGSGTGLTELPITVSSLQTASLQPFLLVAWEAGSRRSIARHFPLLTLSALLLLPIQKTCWKFLQDYFSERSAVIIFHSKYGELFLKTVASYCIFAYRSVHITHCKNVVA